MQTGKIKINGVDLATTEANIITNNKITKTSQLTNNSNFTTGFVTNVNEADAATNLTGNSGVSAGTYGPGSDVSVSGSTQRSISCPQITVNAQGRVTAVNNRTITIQTY